MQPEFAKNEFDFIDFVVASMPITLRSRCSFEETYQSGVTLRKVNLCFPNERAVADCDPEMQQLS